MLAERIYELRRKSGLSQEQLAEKIGVSRQTVSKWESGTSTPELEKLMALSEIFQVSLDELVREQGTLDGPKEVQPAADPARTKLGIGLILAGAMCLILAGLLFLFRPGAVEQLNASSAITLNGSGILLTLCVLSMLAGLFLILRKK